MKDVQKLSALQENTAQILAKNLIYLRKSRSLTQDQLAKLANIPRSTITHFESGSGNPSLHNLVLLSQALEVKVEELLGAPMVAAKLFKNNELALKVKSGCKIFDLMPHPIKGLGMEMMEFDPGQGFTGVPHLKGTKEYFACIQGKAEVMVAGERFEVCKGDVLLFNGDENHSYTNMRSSKTIAVSILFRAE